MNKNKWINMGMGALIALMIGGGAVAATSVSADTDLGNTVLAAINGEEVNGPRDGQGRRGGNRLDKSAFLAEELGITEEALSEARQAARDAATEDTTREERQELFASELGLSVEALEAASEAAEDAAIAEALANGDITQEQVDTKEAKEAFKEVFDKKEAKAEVLGLTVEELEAAKEAGTSKEEILENAGLTQEEAKAAIEQAKADALEEAVTNGDITAEQAELIENAPERNGRGNRNGGGRGNRAPAGGDQADA